jgi:hypothetical protein
MKMPLKLNKDQIGQVKERDKCNATVGIQHPNGTLKKAKQLITCIVWQMIIV